MWDWYNRPGPGRRAPISTRTAFVIMLVGGLAVGALMTILYAVLAPHLFIRVP